MTDLHALLEQAADGIPDAVVPPFEAIIARVRRRRMRRVGSATTAALAVIAAAVIPWALTGTAGHPSSLRVVGEFPSASPLPGAGVVTLLTKPVTIDGAGTKTVELGTPPTGATDIDVKLTCLSAGTFVFDDGASEVCSAADIGKVEPGYQMPLHPGAHSTTMRATAGQRWRLVAAYAKVTTSAWGINADGLTYGVANANGTPDLVAVIATNGKTGYVYAKGLDEPMPANPSHALQQQNSRANTIHLPVYQFDGKTKLGQFEVQRHTTS